MRFTAATSILLVVAACSSSGQHDTVDEPDTDSPSVAQPVPALHGIVQLGADLSPRVGERIIELLRAVSETEWTLADANADTAADADVLIGFGDTAITRRLIHPAQLTELGSEGFIFAADGTLTTPVIAVRGNAIAPDPHGQENLGTSYGAYAVLEAIGFAFLHPLEPSIPDTIVLPVTAFTRTEAPALAIRGIHLHTMHPTELAHVLNGWGAHGFEDGFDDLLPEWERYMEWLLANRQNRVEWALLEGPSWKTFSRSDTRRERLKRLNAIADEWGMATVIVAPMSSLQQHAFRLIPDNEAARVPQLRASVDWLATCDFDEITTESGTSEFTHESADLILEAMNALVDQAASHGMPAMAKIHTSTGQLVEGYVDPVDGGALNVNFLPHYADPRLAVAPHTVQHYGLDDPAPTYGNDDFSHILEFARVEAEAGRDVFWYPETAYWVSFDVDVPLFLPLYAERRVHDLRLILSQGIAIRGQYLFSSGWEWGYWLNDVVAARAAWNPRLDAASDADAFADIVRGALRTAGSTALAGVLVDIAQHQLSLLIRGEYDGMTPSTVVRRNGQAYLQGYETWDDIADLASDSGIASRVRTQPDKLGMVEMQNPWHAAPSYDELAGLLAAMRTTFAADATALESIPATKPWVTELAESMRITALRAEQIDALYAFAADHESFEMSRAERALDRAAGIVTARELGYRADPERLSGWGENPTAYRFGYLWTARSLYYWYRDEGKAAQLPVSPCFLNILNPLDVAFGEGLGDDLNDILRELADVPLVGSLAACAIDPINAPVLGTWR